MNKFGQVVLAESIQHAQADYMQAVDYAVKGDMKLFDAINSCEFALEHEGHFALFRTYQGLIVSMELWGKKSKDFTSAALLQLFREFKDIQRVVLEVQTFGNPQYLPKEFRPVNSILDRTLLDGRQVFSVTYVVDRPVETSTQEDALDDEDEEDLVDDRYNELDKEDSLSHFVPGEPLLDLPATPTQEQLNALKGVESAVNEKIQVPAGIKGLTQGLTLRRG